MSKENKADIELAKWFRRGQFEEPEERYKFNSTRELVRQNGEWKFKLTRRRFKFDQILKEWQKPDVWVTFHELSEFGTVKQSELSLIFVKTRTNENFEEEHAYFIQTFSLEVPNLKRYRNYYFSKSPEGKICVNVLPHSCTELVDDKFFSSEFIKSKTELKRVSEKEIAKLVKEKKVYPVLFGSFGGQPRRLVYQYKG